MKNIFVFLLIYTEIMNQSFKSSELINLCKQVEYILFDISEEDLKFELEKQYEEITSETFEFDIKHTGSFYLTNELKDKLVLRKLMKYMKI